MLPPEMAFIVLCIVKEENEWTSWVYGVGGEEKGPMLQPPGGSVGQLPTCRSAGEVTLSSTEPVRLRASLVAWPFYCRRHGFYPWLGN